MVRRHKAILVGIVVGALGVVLRPTAVGVRLEEDVGLRWLFSIRGPLKPPSDVVVVTIDRGSAQQLGMDAREWPPPRQVHARVIRALASHRVSVIAMDIRFEKHRSPVDDDDLADAIATSGNVALAQHIERLSVPGADVQIEQIHSPIDQLQKSAISLAPFPLPEGTLTHFFWTFFQTSGGEVPTLPAVALQLQALPFVEGFIALLERAGIEGLEVPARVTSVAESRSVMEVLRRKLRTNPQGAARALAMLDADGSGRLSAIERTVFTALLKLYAGGPTYYLNFYGPPGTVETIPFHELMRDGHTERFSLAGKAVFVGEGTSDLVTSADQPDTFPTIYSTSEGIDLSGAEIGATAFANLLSDRALRPLNALGSSAILLGFGILVGLLARLLRGTYAVAIVTAVGATYYGSAQIVFGHNALLLPVAVPLLVQLPLALFVGVFARYRDIRTQVPREIDPQAPLETRLAVCLATDVTDYTRIAAGTSPSDLAPVLSKYYDMLQDIVVRRHGVTSGRAGDSMVCVWEGSTVGLHRDRTARFWSAIHRRSDADLRALRNACLAAIEMRDAIDRFNKAATLQLPTRIGLHVGMTTVGLVGHQYQAVGDAANTAARLQELNKELGTKLLASAAVVDVLEGLVVRRLGAFPLRGIPVGVSVFEILGSEGAVPETSSSLRERFALGLELFESGNLGDAAKVFQQLALEHQNDGPTNYYLRECAKARGTPFAS